MRDIRDVYPEFPSTGFCGLEVEGVVAGADAVLVSSAVPSDDVEITEALRSGIPVVKRPEFLGWLTGAKETIATALTKGLFRKLRRASFRFPYMQPRWFSHGGRSPWRGECWHTRR